MRKLVGMLLLGAAAALAGCGGATPGTSRLSGSGTQPRIAGEPFSPVAQPAASALAQETTHEGQPAVKLDNGLVTVLVLPAQGGRIAGYKLGDYEYLWSPPAGAAGNSDEPQPPGGDWLVPIFAEQPGGLPEGPPEAFHAEPWTSEITSRSGVLAEVKLTSPEDPQTGVQLTRSLRLHSGSTRLQVTDAVVNLTDRPLTVGLRTVTQMTGSRGSGRPRGEVRAYLPLAAAGSAGYRNLLSEEDQGQVSVQDRLLEVAYRGYPAKLGARTPAGWIAYSETGGNYAYVRRFTVSPLGEYPDQGAQALVYTSGWEDNRGGFLALETVAPLREVQPGERYSFSQDWLATVTPGPIVETSEAAAISRPLKLVREGEGYRLRGQLGVFAAATLTIALLDASGQPLEDPVLVQASPGEAVDLDQALPGRLGVSGVRLSLQSERGTPLGEIAQLPLPGPGPAG